MLLYHDNISGLLFLLYIQLMAEEKIRNYKITTNNSCHNENIPSFLLKTYQILENSKYSDVICWTKNGEGFIVKKVKQFSQNILPIHFRHSNYTSFVRQLNMYDFHKTRQENQENAFKHSMFKRGQKNMLKQIQRKDYKKKREKPQVPQKISAINNQNEVKQNKKIQYEKEFYIKGLDSLQKINEEMNQKQSQLAIIDESNINQSDEITAELLQFLFNIKNLNNSWYKNLAILGKQWQNLLINKKSMLKQELQTQNNGQSKKNLEPTMVSMNSLNNN